MWPEVTCVTTERMEEHCFDTTVWWGWNCIHDCSHEDDYNPPATYYDGTLDPMYGGNEYIDTVANVSQSL